MLSWEFPPSSAGGMAAHVDGLAHAMQRAGHEVVLITRLVPGADADTTAGGIRVLRVDTDMPWLPDQPVAAVASANHAFVAATAALGSWRPDIIHGHDWGVAWASDVLSRLHGVPIVTTFHGTERGRHGGHLPPGAPTDVNSVEWWQAFRSRRVIAGTRLMVREITGGFEMDPDHVKRVPAGIDPAWWEATGPDEAVGEPRGKLVVAWGRVRYEKGFQILARAVGIAAPAGARARVHDRRPRQLPARAPVADRHRGRRRPHPGARASCRTTSCAPRSTAPAAW